MKNQHAGAHCNFAQRGFIFTWKHFVGEAGEKTQKGFFWGEGKGERAGGKKHPQTN